jgi:hypothetical protein
VKESLAAIGIASRRIHAEIFNGGEPMTPGIVAAAERAAHLPVDDANTGPLVSFSRSGIAAHWKPSYQSIVELAEACDVPVRWPAGLVSVIVARAAWSLERSSTDPSRSTSGPMEISSSAARDRAATSSSICDGH